MKMDKSHTGSEYNAIMTAIQAIKTLDTYREPYNKGWDDGAKATYEHLKMCEEETETGHCKDCKYFEYDSVAIVDKIPLIVAHEICSRWGDGCKTKEDGYCFLFEPQESDHKCHTCKHYTSGEHDGSCGSYICKGYSNWESEVQE
jgi:hypothetical protein